MSMESKELFLHRFWAKFLYLRILGPWIFADIGKKFDSLDFCRYRQKFWTPWTSADVGKNFDSWIFADIGKNNKPGTASKYKVLQG